MTTPVRCALFDVDGTLINSEDFNRTLLRDTLAQFGIRVSDEMLDALRGRTIRHCYEELAPHVPFEECFVAHRILEIDRVDEVRAFHDVHMTLPALQSHGVLLGVHSSRRRRSLHELLDRTLLFGFFPLPHIFGFEDVTHPKPDPEGIRRLLDIVGASASETLYIGDTHIDVQAARAAGVRAAVVARDGPVREDIRSLEPDFVFTDLRFLLPVCGIS